MRRTGAVEVVPIIMIMIMIMIMVVVVPKTEMYGRLIGWVCTEQKMGRIYNRLMTTND